MKRTSPRLVLLSAVLSLVGCFNDSDDSGTSQVSVRLPENGFEPEGTFNFTSFDGGLIVGVDVTAAP